MGLPTILSAINGVDQGVLGFQQGRQQQLAANQQHEQQAQQMMFKMALESAAKRQTQANSDRTFNLEQSRFDLEKNKKTPQDQISARVSDLVGQGTPLLDASRQARQEFGRTTPGTPLSPEYIASMASLQKARDAVKVPRVPTRAPADPNSPVRASQQERYFSQVADRAVQASGGDVDAAANSLVQDPSTANIFSQGMSASHLNAAAARYRLRTMAGRSAGASPLGQPGAAKPRLSDLIAPQASAATTPRPQAAGKSQQQSDWDEAATALGKQGNRNPETVLGVRPQH